MRFYLAEIPEFSDVDQFLFFDDDVVVTGDVKKLWDHHPPKEDKTISAGCLNFARSEECDRFVGSFTMSYSDNAPLLGFPGHSIDDALCENDDDVWCLPPKFIAAVRDALPMSDPLPYSKEWLESKTSWNFGVNKFDLIRWRELDMTGKFLTFLRANLDHGLIPTTTLAYGIGIAFMLFADEIDCLDPVAFPIFHGLGFVRPVDFVRSDYTVDLGNAFALHWAGSSKAWDAEPDFVDFVSMFLKYAPGSIVRSVQDRAVAALKKEPTKKKQPLATFLLWTEAPSEALDWINLVLQGLTTICIPGLVQLDMDGVVSNPEYRSTVGNQTCLHIRSACDFGLLVETANYVAEARNQTADPCTHFGEDHVAGKFQGMLPVACSLGTTPLTPSKARTAYDAYLVAALTRSFPDHDAAYRKIILDGDQRGDPWVLRVELPCFCDEKRIHAVGVRFKVDQSRRQNIHHPVQFSPSDTIPETTNHFASLLTDRGAKAVIIEHPPVDPAITEYRRRRDEFLNDTAIPALRISYNDCEFHPIACLTRIIYHISPDYVYRLATFDDLFQALYVQNELMNGQFAHLLHSARVHYKSGMPRFHYPHQSN